MDQTYSRESFLAIPFDPRPEFLDMVESTVVARLLATLRVETRDKLRKKHLDEQFWKRASDKFRAGDFAALRPGGSVIAKLEGDLSEAVQYERTIGAEALWNVHDEMALFSEIAGELWRRCWNQLEKAGIRALLQSRATPGLLRSDGEHLIAVTARTVETNRCVMDRDDVHKACESLRPGWEEAVTDPQFPFSEKFTKEGVLLAAEEHSEHLIDVARRYTAGPYGVHGSKF